MATPKDNLCTDIRNEGVALIEMGAILAMGSIRYEDAIEVLDASIEKLEWARNLMERLIPKK